VLIGLVSPRRWGTGREAHGVPGPQQCKGRVVRVEQPKVGAPEQHPAAWGGLRVDRGESPTHGDRTGRDRGPRRSPAGDRGELGREPGQIRESGREAQKGDLQVGAGELADDRGGAPTDACRYGFEVGTVEGHGNVDAVPDRCRTRRRMGASCSRLPVGEFEDPPLGRAHLFDRRVEVDHHAAEADHRLPDALRRQPAPPQTLEGIGQPVRRCDIIDLDQEGTVPVSLGPAGHGECPPLAPCRAFGEKGRRAIPSVASIAWTVRAVSAALGASPCMHSVSASIAVHVPSTASTP